MKYAVDEIIDNKVVLENIETKETTIEELSKFKNKVKEGQIYEYREEYILDNEEEQKRRQRIEEKFNRLKKVSNND